MSDTFDDRDRPSSESFRPEEPSPPPSGCRNFAIGCGCAFGVLLLVVACIGVWIAMNWKIWVADGAKQVAADAVARSTLSADDKKRVLNRINQLADDFKDGQVSNQQLVQVMQAIAASPLLPLGLVMAADEKYLKPSGLSADDKEAGRRTLQRFARGAFEKSIADHDVQDAMKLLMEKQPDGSDQLKEHLTDPELAAFLAKAKDKADAANVPDEPFEVNIADELDKAIDKVLKPEQPPQP
jgi:hypothetical protein